MRIMTETYYTTVKMMMTREFKRRRRIPADPGSRAVMCDVSGETYTLRLVPLVEWGITRRGKEPIVDDDANGSQTTCLGFLDPTDQFREEDWVGEAAEWVKELNMKEGRTP